MELEFLKCQSNHWVPVVNGNLMHSAVDPVKEARQLVEKEWDRLRDVQGIIVLGLGGGIHIEEILRRRDVSIVVIESSKELVLAMNEKNPELMEKISVVAGTLPSQVTREQEVMNITAHSYSVFKHPASMRVSGFYYAPILLQLCDRSLRGVLNLVSANSRLTSFFSSLDISESQILTLPMIEEAMIRRGVGLEKEGLIWMALRELVI